MSTRIEGDLRAAERGMTNSFSNDSFQLLYLRLTLVQVEPM